MPKHQYPQLALGVDDAAQAAGIGRTALYALLREGSGPASIKLGRRRLPEWPARCRFYRLLRLLWQFCR